MFDDAGRILPQCRSDFDVWGLPGGSIEVGETLEQAAVSEVEEESGYDVEIVRLIGAYSDPRHTTTRYPSGDVVHYVSLVVECRVTGGRLKTDVESSGMAWFARGDLPPDVMPDHRPRIDDAFARRPTTVVR